ncbi:unnamed protein product [Ophioblennius macclurei]
MAMWTTLVPLLLILHSVVGQSTIRWCTISENEDKKCNAMSDAFSKASVSPTISCVNGDSAEGCAEKLEKKEVDAFSMSGSEIYKKSKIHSFKMAASESKNGYAFAYHAVAVVKKSNTNININNLKGKKSCHTGKGRTAGWNIPIGYLVNEGHMSVMGCDFAQGVASFFSESCIPGFDQAGDPPSLCKLCKGDGAGGHKCEWDAKEMYFGYEGAFRCLAEGAGEVAFIKQTVVEENTDGRGPAWAKDFKSADFELLCPDGSRTAIANWRRCHLAGVPFRGVVVNADIDPSVVVNMLKEGQTKSGFAMFSSTSYGGGTVLFSDQTTELKTLSSDDPKEWMNDGYYASMETMTCNTADVPSELRWCLVSSEEEKKCQAMSSAFTSKGLTPKIGCVRGDSEKDCMDKIKNNKADAITLSGSEIYMAGKDYGLIPAAAETYTAGDQDGFIYYAVAVVKATTNIPNFESLRGQRSCHTGYGRTAGWNVIAATLMDKGLISPENCDIAGAMGGFFKESCIPGANQGGMPSNLCELCKGDASGQNKCDFGKDLYAGYDGAFRCLAEGTGDVAFVKQNTVPDNTDGKGTDQWNKNLKSKDYRLLCTHGSVIDVSHYKECNLARVPSYAVMVRPGTNINIVYGLLDKAQEHFGSDSGSMFKMFDSQDYQGKDLIFKDSTVRLISVKDRKTYEEWLGPIYTKAMAVRDCNSSSAVVSSLWLLMVALFSTVLTNAWM